MTRAVNRPRPAAAPRIALLALALACLAEPTAAQRPTSKQINAIRQACRADYQSHCANVPTGGQASVNCLEENYAKLSAPCQKSLSVLGPPPTQPAAAPPPATATPPAAAAPPAAAPPPATAAPPATTSPPVAAAPPATSPPAAEAPPTVPLRVELAILRQACGRDFRKFCRGTRPGGGRVIACLEQNGASLSARCQRALQRLASGAR